MCLRSLCALLALFVAFEAGAFIEASVSLRDLYGRSSVVAVVDLIEGQAVSAEGQSCGARYKARVIEGTKNATQGQLIEFGFATSLKVGARYFVLLDGYKNVPVPQLPDFQARCKHALPGLAIVGLLRGAMEVTSVGDSTRPDTWTVRRRQLVEYPIGTRSKRVNGEQQLVFTDMVARMKATPAASR